MLRVEVDHGVHVNASSVQKFTFMSYIDQLCKCGLGSRFTFSCAVHLYCQSMVTVSASQLVFNVTLKFFCVFSFDSWKADS